MDVILMCQRVEVQSRLVAELVFIIIYVICATAVTLEVFFGYSRIERAESVNDVFISMFHHIELL